MGMDYATSLLTGAQLVEHSGVQGLANLATSAELVLDTFTLRAHQAVWRKLKARGIDPTALSNESLLKDAVAFEAIARLALAGYLPGIDGLSYERLSTEACTTGYRPEFTADTDTGRHAGEGVPVVGHVDEGGLTFSDDVPSLL